jgi:hypothetical protein
MSWAWWDAHAARKDPDSNFTLRTLRRRLAVRALNASSSATVEAAT